MTAHTQHDLAAILVADGDTFEKRLMLKAIQAGYLMHEGDDLIDRVTLADLFKRLDHALAIADAIHFDQA